jgi:hypothetical protein
VCAAKPGQNAPALFFKRKESSSFFEKKEPKKLLTWGQESFQRRGLESRSFLRNWRPDDRAQRGLNRAAQRGSKKRPLA